tara:strand:+ start:387 stop:767 length:381 start_codon:yes stop_codon:yes gene_type:complete
MSKPANDGRVRLGMRLGLGDAVLRLIHVEDEARGRAHPNRAAVLAERALLLDALNRTVIDLGFDCDGDGLADTAIGDVDGDGIADVSIFQHTAATSCCRILPQIAPASDPDTPAAPRRRRSSSRRK